MNRRGDLVVPFTLLLCSAAPPARAEPEATPPVGEAAFPVDAEPPPVAPDEAAEPAPVPPKDEPAAAPRDSAPRRPAHVARPLPYAVSEHDSVVESRRQARTKGVTAGLGLSLGLAFGGETLLTAVYVDGSTSDLNAGQGVIVGASGFLVPLHFGRLGIGMGVDFGWKYTSVTASNVTISLSRFPLEVTLRCEPRLGEHVELVMAGGLHYEVGVGLSGSGELEGAHVSIDNALGWTVGGGILYTENDWGIEVTVRHAGLEYRAVGATADASSTGVFGGIFYVL